MHSNNATDEEEHRKQCLDTARKLVTALEGDDENEVARHLHALASRSYLYRHIGRMAREVHDYLRDFLAGSGLAAMAHNEAPDTRRRLEHVIELTDEAAHRTLESVEKIRMNADAIIARCSIAQDADQSELITQTRDDVDVIRGELGKIVMAQEYQDLSGQIIHRTIALVTDIEARLVELVRMAGLSVSEIGDRPESGTAHGEGPRVVGTSNQENVADQDEVDELLKSLGF